MQVSAKSAAVALLFQALLTVPALAQYTTSDPPVIPGTAPARPATPNMTDATHWVWDDEMDGLIPNITQQLFNQPNSNGSYTSKAISVWGISSKLNGLFPPGSPITINQLSGVAGNYDAVLNLTDGNNLVLANRKQPVVDLTDMIADEDTFAVGAIRFATAPTRFWRFNSSNVRVIDPPVADKERMTILSNGNISMGMPGVNPQPQCRLVVEGRPYGSGGKVVEVIDDTQDLTVPSYGGVTLASYFGSDFTLGKKTVSNSETYFQIRKHGTGLTEAQKTLMTISHTGNVGIGTLTPKEKLVVAGTICAQEVRVSLTSDATCWPDYVFAPDYSLMPLEELDQYVRDNRHLPGIPTAQDVVNNGVELGEMQAQLLRKVEELTLYVIELKKENDAIRAQLAGGGN